MRRFVPLIFTDCPRSLDQAFVVSRLRITRREYFTSNPDAHFTIYLSVKLCAFSLKVTEPRRELPKYRRSAMENLIIKTDVTVSIITIFYTAPNKSNEPAELISLQLRLTTSAIYLHAHGLRFVSQCYYNFQPRLIQYHRSY